VITILALSEYATLHISSYTKFVSVIQKFMGGDSQTYTQHGYLISLLLFFQNKERRLKSDLDKNWSLNEVSF
jgi:hypothetical protein